MLSCHFRSRGTIVNYHSLLGNLLSWEMCPFLVAWMRKRGRYMPIRGRLETLCDDGLWIAPGNYLQKEIYRLSALEQALNQSRRKVKVLRKMMEDFSLLSLRKGGNLDQITQPVVTETFRTEQCCTRCDSGLILSQGIRDITLHNLTFLFSHCTFWSNRLWFSSKL
jgi:hypothetical protein